MLWGQKHLARKTSATLAAAARLNLLGDYIDGNDRVQDQFPIIPSHLSHANRVGHSPRFLSANDAESSLEGNEVLEAKDKLGVPQHTIRIGKGLGIEGEDFRVAKTSKFLQEECFFTHRPTATSLAQYIPQQPVPAVENHLE